jgi:hypothetical protein
MRPSTTSTTPPRTNCQTPPFTGRRITRARTTSGANTNADTRFRPRTASHCSDEIRNPSRIRIDSPRNPLDAIDHDSRNDT